MEKMLCYSPTPGKAPTKIDLDKYLQVAEAILNVLPEEGDGLVFKDLQDLVADYIGESKMQTIGSRTWYTTTVKLHLETEGKIKRVAVKGPQRLIKVVSYNQLSATIFSPDSSVSLIVNLIEYFHFVSVN